MNLCISVSLLRGTRHIAYLNCRFPPRNYERTVNGGDEVCAESLGFFLLYLQERLDGLGVVGKRLLCLEK